MDRLRCLVLNMLMLLLSACASGARSSTPPDPPPFTPTLLGTANPPTHPPATAAHRPAACIFRTSPADEIGVYRFDWQNAALTLDTRIGPLIVDGPRSLAPGWRRLILLQNTRLAGPSSVIVNFDVGGTLVDDPLLGVQEVRDAGGTVVTQTMADPAGDTRGLPDYLDIVRVERAFGYYPNSLARVYLAGIHSGPYIWTFQSVAVSVAGVTYTQQNYYDGRIALIETDGQGRVKPWPGPVTVEANAFAFALQTGIDQGLTAFTSTSSGGGDVAGPYPAEAMQAVWEAARRSCP